MADLEAAAERHNELLAVQNKLLAAIATELGNIVDAMAGDEAAHPSYPFRPSYTTDGRAAYSVKKGQHTEL